MGHAFNLVVFDPKNIVFLLHGSSSICCVYLQGNVDIAKKGIYMYVNIKFSCKVPNINTAKFVHCKTTKKSRTLKQMDTIANEKLFGCPVVRF